MGNDDACPALPGSPEGKDHWINKVLLISQQASFSTLWIIIHGCLLTLRGWDKIPITGCSFAPRCVSAPKSSLSAAFHARAVCRTISDLSVNLLPPYMVLPDLLVIVTHANGLEILPMLSSSLCLKHLVSVSCLKQRIKILKYHCFKPFYAKAFSFLIYPF